MAKISWDNGQGGFWTTASDWSGGVVPGAADDVTISIAPPANFSYAVELDDLTVAVHSLTLDQASATVSLFASQLSTDLILDAGTVSLDLSSLSGQIDGAGTGLISMFEGTLVAERISGSATIQSESGTIAGGLTLVTTHRTKGTLSLAGTLEAQGSQAWGGGTIQLGGGTVSLQGSSSTPETLTLASTLDVVVGGNASIGSGPLYPGMIVNQGSIAVAAGSLLLEQGSIVNTGSISARAGSAIDILAGTLTNRGTITAFAGSTLTLDAGSLVNRGAIDIAGGTLALGGTLVIGGTEVSIATFKDAVYTDGGIGAIEGTVANTGDTLRFGTGGLPPIELAAGGVIDGGTVISNGGLSFDGGSLEGVAFKGSLDLSETSASVTVTGNLAGRPAHGPGLGTIMLTGPGSALILSGLGTLSGVSIDAGGSAGTGYYGTPSGAAIEVGGSTASTYTLAAGSTLTQTGAVLNFEGYYNYYQSPTPEFINRGAIVATDAVGTLSVQYVAFLNAGSILVAGGEQMSVISDYEFVNTGIFTIAALGVATVGDNAFSNTGTLDVASGGTLQILADLATSALGSVSVAAGGTLSIGELLNNAGDTLRIGAGSSIALLELSGQIDGGTIVAGSGGLLADGGSLYDVTFEGVLSVGGPGEASLNIDGGDGFVGANGSGPGSLLLTGISSIIDFLDPGLLDDVSITLASASSTFAGGNYTDNSVAVPLSLGSTVRITQTGEAATFGVTDIQTAATITAAVAGGTFTLTGTIANSGTIAISNGETLALAVNSLTNPGLIRLTGGVLEVSAATLAELQAVTVRDSVADVSGALDLQGGTLSLSNDGISLFRVGGNPGDGASRITDGTIADPNRIVQLAGDVVFSGVTYQGTLTLNRPLTTLDLIDGSSVTDSTGKLPGLIDLTGAGASLDTDTLDRVTIDIGSALLNYDGTSVAPASLSAQALGSGVTVDQTGPYAALFDQGDDNSSLASAATIDADVYRGAFGIWGGSVTSTGPISIGNSDIVTIGSANFVNDGLITLGNSQGYGDIVLDTYAYFASGTLAESSFTNVGTVQLSYGSIVEYATDGALSNVPILNEGSIEGSGGIDADMINNGVVEATSGGEISLERTVGGSGTLQVDAGAALQLAGVGGNQTVVFSGTGGALDLAPMEFLGKIAGFESGDTIDLLRTAASSASFVGDSIVVSLTAGGTITLETTSALSGSLTVTTVDRFDSLISFAGSSAQHALFGHLS